MIVKQTEPEFAALLRIADGLEPELRAAFLDALTALRTQLPLNTLTELLEADALTQLGALVADLKLPDSIVNTLRQVMTQAATKAGTFAGGRIGLSFNLDNPAVIRWVESNTAQHILGIENETKLAVRDIVRRGFIEGNPPREQARLIREIVGLTERDAGAVAAFKQGLTEADTPRRLVDSQVERMSNRLRNRRAEMIARTETVNAANRGQLEAWKEAADQGLIDPTVTRRVWIATDDARTCPICNELDGKTVGFVDAFPVNQSAIEVGRPKSVFPDHDGLAPPAHVACRCSTGLVFD